MEVSLSSVAREDLQVSTPRSDLRGVIHSVLDALRMVGNQFGDLVLGGEKLSWIVIYPIARSPSVPDFTNESPSGIKRPCPISASSNASPRIKV
jgi:hypothetical protein